MRSRLMQIAEGKIYAPEPVLTFSEEKLKSAVLPDKVLKTELEIRSESRIPLRMFFNSSNPRVTVPKTATVSGNLALEVEVDSRGLFIFDEIRGTVEVLYQGGEKSIPYHFTVGPEKGTKGLSFATLEEFARFARLHFEEAAVLFSVREFALLPFMKNLRLQSYYHVFKEAEEAEKGLREFLKAAGIPDIPKQGVKKAAEPETPRAAVELSASSRKIRAEKKLLAAFLRYEVALHTGEDLPEAGREIERLSALYPDEPYATLLSAYRDLQEEETAKAKDLLLKVQDGIQKNRLDRKAEYGLFLYLAAIVQGDGERIENARKLIKKYYEEEPTSVLLSMMEYRVNHDPENDPKEAEEFLRQCWFKGMRSRPVLESTALLYAEAGIVPDALTEYEMLSVLYGLRNGLFDEQQLFRILRKGLSQIRFLPLYFLLLKTGYRRFGHKDLLYAIVDLFLQRKMTGERYFSWYREGVERGLTLPGLFDGYLLSLPRTFSGALPESVVEHFAVHRESDGIDRAVLYANILEYYRERPDILKNYRSKIEEFAIRSMKEERYSRAMKPVYETILSREYVNEETARPMLSLFALNEAETTLPDMKRIVLYYPEIDVEETYALDAEGRAVVPVWSGEAVFVLENRKGERFFDPGLSMERCFRKDDLEKQCMLYSGNSLRFRLREAEEIVEGGGLREENLIFLTELIRDKRISGLYRTRLYEVLVDHCLEQGTRLSAADLLLEADFLSFSRAYRVKILDLFLREKRDRAVMEAVLEYGMEGYGNEILKAAAETAFVTYGMKEDPKVLALAVKLFRDEEASDKVLEYLAMHEHGSAEELSSLLKAVRKRKVSAFDLPERTIAVMLFTNRAKDLDAAYEALLSGTGRNDLVERAYLVRRAHDCFTEGRKLPETAMRELKKRVFALPSVAMFALFTVFSKNRANLSKDDRELLRKLLLHAVEKDVVLGCFRDFEEMEEMPFELANRVFQEFRDPEAAGVSMAGKVFPEQREFHREMNEVYPGVFTQSFFLYRQEWIQYSFVIRLAEGGVREQEGNVLSRRDLPGKRGGRYEELMTLEKKIASGDMKETAEFLRQMLEKEAVIEEIFR